MQRFFRKRVQPLLLLAQGSSLSVGQQLETERAKTRAALEQMEKERQEFLAYKKRAERRAASAHTSGIREVCTKLIPALEDMQRLQGLPECVKEDDPWGQGYVMSHGELAKTLRAIGMVRFCRVGERFDPQRHYAIGVEYRPNLEENVILAIVRCGYLFRTNNDPATDTLLQVAQVIVSTQNPTLVEKQH